MNVFEAVPSGYLSVFYQNSVCIKQDDANSSRTGGYAACVLMS